MVSVLTSRMLAPLLLIKSNTIPNKSFSLRNVLHVPNIQKNLVKISQLTAENNVFVEFHSNFCLVKEKDTKKVLLHGRLKDGLYLLSKPEAKAVLSCTSVFHVSLLIMLFLTSLCLVLNMLGLVLMCLYIMSKRTCSTFSVSTALSADVWHRRLVHPYNRTLSIILKSCKILHSINANYVPVSFCTACQYGKSHVLPFKLAETKTKKPLELIATDLYGPSPVLSPEGYRYCIHFLDDFTRFTWTFPLRTKGETLAVFQQFRLSSFY